MQLGSLAGTLIATVITLIPAAAKAAIIDHDTYLTDTVSGLDWLDVTITVGRSYNDVSAKFGQAQEFQGWRYANGLEFNELIKNATGITPAAILGQLTYQETPELDNLISTLGSTLDSQYMRYVNKTYDAYWGFPEGEGIDVTWGLVSDTVDGAPSPSHYVGMIYDWDYGPSQQDLSIPNHSFIPDGWKLDYAGSFLVRTTAFTESISNVPEPTTFALVVAALGALVLRRRKTHFRPISK